MPAENTSDRLVAAGVDLLEDGGLAGLTLRRIAQAAGVSHGAPRHHFPTYDGLLAAIARVGVDDLDRRLAPCFAERDAAIAVHRAAHAYLDFARERPEMFELIARHDLLEGAGGHLRGTTGRWFAALHGALATITCEPDEAIATRAMALWSGVHGVAVLSNRRTAEPLTAAPPDPAAAVTLLVDSLLTPR